MQVEIDHSSCNRGMTEEIFDGVNVCPLGKKVGGKTVPETVQSPASFYTGFFFAFLK